MLVKMIRQFATAQDIAQLQRWISELFVAGALRANPSGPGRFFVPLGAVESPKRIKRLTRELRKELKVTGGCLDLTDLDVVNRTKATPSFVGMQIQGGAVHPHTDKNTGEYQQLRCTLLVNKPESGGRVLLATQEYELDEGDVYCFLSNNTVHGTTPVGGNKPRMTCSLGFLVSGSFLLS
jgi:hypothetical protein